MVSSFGPVGNINKQVIFQSFFNVPGVLAAPYRETQIITNHQVNLPSFYRGDQSFCTGGIVLVFSRKGKTMTFIIMSIFAIGKHPDKAIVITGRDASGGM